MPISDQQIITAYCKYAPKWEYPLGEATEMVNRFEQDESILGVISVQTSRPENSMILGFLVFTNKRLGFFEMESHLFGNKRKVRTVVSFPLNTLMSVEYEQSHGLFSVIYILITSFQGKNKYQVMDRKTNYQGFIEDVKRLVSSPKKSEPVQNYSENSQDLLSQLERLVKLKEQGLITNDEFAKAKEKLLS